MQTNRDPLYWLAWLIFLTAVALVSRSYIPVDETRYLSVAWEMWHRGDFLVPFKNGEPYSHKPPLLFWLMHAGWAVVGVNDWWPRLISPILALASLFLVRRLATELWPGQPVTARLAPWILLGSLLWTLYSQTIMFDLLMAFCTLLGILALIRASNGTRHAWKLFALAIGLGVLAKGPAILLHLLPAALLAPLWRNGDNISLRQWYGRTALAVLAGVGIALLWAIPAGFAGGEEYRRAIFWGQTANRMVESFAHKRPIWWYLPLLPILLFPWFVWRPFWRGVRTPETTQDKGLRLTLAWMLPAFVAFSMISGKQVHYLLPEFPAFALFAARLLAGQQTIGRPWLAALMLGALGITLLVLPHMGPSYASDALAQMPAWIGLPFLALAGATWVQRATPAVLVPRLAAVAMLTMAMVHLLAIRPISAAYNVRPMATAIAQVQDQHRPVANLGGYHAQYQFAGRLTQPVEELSGSTALKEWVAQHGNGAVVLYFRHPVDFGQLHPRFTQPYRGQQAVLFDAVEAIAALKLIKAEVDTSSEE